MFSKGKLEFHLYNELIIQIRYQLKYINTCIFSQLHVTVYEDLKWFYYLQWSLFVNMFLKDKTFSNMYKANTCTIVNALK